MHFYALARGLKILVVALLLWRSRSAHPPQATSLYGFQRRYKIIFIVQILKNFLTRLRFCDKIGAKFCFAEKTLKKRKKPLDAGQKISIIVYINKENEMQEMKKVEKAKRPSKKVLMAEIEKMGVDQKIVASLGRANIETIQWVKSLIS